MRAIDNLIAAAKPLAYDDRLDFIADRMIADMVWLNRSALN